MPQRPIPLAHPYRPTWLEVQAVRHLGGSWTQRAADLAYLNDYKTAPVDTLRHIYNEGHTLYKSAVAAVRDRSDCPAALVAKPDRVGL